MSRSKLDSQTTNSPARPATPHKIIRLSNLACCMFQKYTLDQTYLRVEKPDQEEGSSANSIRRSERKPESVLVKKLLSTTDDSCLGIEIFDTVCRGRGIKVNIFELERHMFSSWFCSLGIKEVCQGRLCCGICRRPRY